MLISTRTHWRQGRTQRGAGGGGSWPPPPIIVKAKIILHSDFKTLKLFYQLIRKSCSLSKIINQRIVHGHSPLYVERHSIPNTARYSEGSVNLKIRYSEGSLFRRFVIPKVRYSEGSLIRR